MSDNRPPVYFEGDIMVIRASAIGGSCLWELAGFGQGYDPAPLPDNLRRAFDQGDYFEPIILQKMRDEGWHLGREQEEFELEVGPNIIIRMHPDSVGFKVTGASASVRYVVEAKALSNDLWQTFVRSGMQNVIHEYGWQASCLMYGFQLPLMWVGYNKGNADGTPCDDQGRVHYQALTEPLVDLDTIRGKAADIRALVEGDDLIDSERACDNPGQWPCRFLHLRPEPEPEDGPIPGYVSVGDDADGKVDDMVRQYLFHKGQADESKERAEAIRDELLGIAGADAKGIVTDKWQVPVYDGTGTRFDYASMPAELREALNKYKVKTPYRYIKGIKRRD